MAEPEPINSIGNIKKAGYEDKLRIKKDGRPKHMMSLNKEAAGKIQS